MGGWATALPSPEGEGVSRKADGWGRPLGGTATEGCRGDYSLNLSALSLPQAGEGGPLAVDGDD